MAGACHRCASRGNANVAVYRGAVIVLRRRALSLVVCGLCAAIASSAGAQAIAPAARSAREADAHVDRVLLVPTAETHPQGTLFLTAYEVLIPSIGYALSDDVQVSATGLTDFTAGAFELRVKANVVRTSAVRLAVGTSLDYLFSDPEDQEDPTAESDFLLGRADAIAQICFDDSCRSSLSSAVTVAAPAQNELIFPVAFGTGVTIQGSSLVTLLLEYGAILNAADDIDLLPLPLHVVSYGARLTWSTDWALDLGFARSLNPQRSVRTAAPGLFDVVGIPLLALTYRSMRTSTM